MVKKRLVNYVESRQYITTYVESHRHESTCHKDDSIFVPILRTVTCADNTCNRPHPSDECCRANDFKKIKIHNAKVGPEFFENICGNKSTEKRKNRGRREKKKEN